MHMDTSLIFSDRSRWEETKTRNKNSKQKLDTKTYTLSAILHCWLHTLTTTMMVTLSLIQGVRPVPMDGPPPGHVHPSEATRGPGGQISRDDLSTAQAATPTTNLSRSLIPLDVEPLFLGGSGYPSREPSGRESSRGRLIL